MSEAILVSPLLDGFLLGSPMGSHDGVVCYPAVKEGSDTKYIVKEISIPASQVQLDALLLLGAYKDPASAMDYFKELADDIVAEAQTLQKLAKLEGFLSYEGWQIVPMEKGNLGYKVYLLGTYKRSLEKHMRRHMMTHLEAVNLGLDLCQALAICRQAGYLYVDLKPGNIFISREKEYRIGDFGLMNLDSLKYLSLPGKYRSPYSPPEASNDLNTLNKTEDTYAVGMILYQVFNEGRLPVGEPGTTPSPVNADYELAEIIMKAISPKPEDRWQDPIEMGKAIVSYMQRNSVNNTPLTVAAPIINEIEPVSLPKKKEKPASVEVSQVAEPPQITEEFNENEVSEEISAVISQVEEETAPQEAEPPVEAQETTVFRKVNVAVKEPVTTSVALMEEPEEEPAEEEAVAEEDSELLFNFDEDEEKEFDLDIDGEDEDYDEDEILEDVPSLKEKKPKKPMSKVWIIPIVVLLITALIGGGAYYYYQNMYLQTVTSMTVAGTQNQLTVNVNTDADESLLTITCSDTYGNVKMQPVSNGQAVFTELLPNSQYRIELVIDGFHKLVGKTTDVYNTQAQTNIISFTAIAGNEEGSVMLTLTAEGPEPEEWNITYSAPGEDAKTESFTGHNVTIKGLALNKVYTFILGVNDMQLLGQSTLEFNTKSLVVADELRVVSCEGNTMTVQWGDPSEQVESWSVRCYSDGGYDKVLEVTETQVTFDDINPKHAHTIEVTASGMTKPSRTTITANPINVKNITVDESDLSKLTVNWEFDGKAPDGGWHLMVSTDGGKTQSVVKCDDASGIITPALPGCEYAFTIQAADGTSIFGNIHSFRSADAEKFERHSLSGDKITASLLNTPQIEGWVYENVQADAFRDKFQLGSKLSVVLKGEANFYIPNDEMEVLYIFRDPEGGIFSDLTATAKINWNDLWYAGDYHYGELDLPVVPDKAGDYVVEFYFDHAYVTSATFTMVE